MNNKLTWIIENFVKEKSYLDLSSAVKRAGYDLIEIKGDYSSSSISHLNGQPAIFQGSINMAKICRNTLPDSKPLIYCNFPAFKCSTYYSHFGEFLFNDKYTLLSLAELKRQKFFIYGVYGKDALIFIRPDDGEKSFQAQLLDMLDFESFYKEHEDLKHELVLVSNPKNIRWEGRFVVDGTKIISYSTYRFQGQVTKVFGAPAEAIELVNKVLKVNYRPDPVYCVDVAQDNDGNCWLLELTSFSSAGLYECNKDDIVREVSKIALNANN